MHWQELVARPSTQFDCPTAVAVAVDDSRLRSYHASHTNTPPGRTRSASRRFAIAKNTGRLDCHPSFRKTVRTVSARPFVPECPLGGAVCAKRVGAGKVDRSLHIVVGQTSQAARRARNMRFPPSCTSWPSRQAPSPLLPSWLDPWRPPGHNHPERRSFASSNEKPQTQSNLGSDAPFGHCAPGQLPPTRIHSGPSMELDPAANRRSPASEGRSTSLRGSSSG